MKNPKSHVNLVAAFHIGWGSLTVLGAVITFIVFNFTAAFVEQYDEIATLVMGALGTFIPILIFIGGAINVLSGIFLFSYKQWTRIFMMVISAINCMNIPIGTGIGIYSLWALSQKEVMELFE